jgi:hypothetical protein
MPTIFISYRREDSAGSAGRIYDRLRHHFSAEDLFIDVDTVQPGVDFIVAIETAVRSCDVLIAIIGTRWLDVTDRHGRRIDNPDDLVRTEVLTALKSGIRVIPVLVNGANMPHSQDLPEPLRPLTRRAAVEVGHTRFDADMDFLVKALKKAVEGSVPRKTVGDISPPDKTFSPHSSRLTIDNPIGFPHAHDPGLFTKLKSLGEDRVEALHLPRAIYGGIWLSPDARTVYISRLREKIGVADYYDLIAYDMRTGAITSLADVGTDDLYYAGFDKAMFYKSASVENYKRHTILRFSGPKGLGRVKDGLVVNSFDVINDKLVYKVDNVWFWMDAQGLQKPLALGDNLYRPNQACPQYNLVLLQYVMRPKAEKKSALYTYRLARVDAQFNVDQILWTYSDEESKRFGYMREWTDNSVLFVEKTDTNGDGTVDYTDKRNSTVKALTFNSGDVSTVVAERLNLRFLAGHGSGLLLYADEVSENEHTRLLVRQGSLETEMMNLRGGHFLSFQLDEKWTTMVYKRVDDTTRRGKFYSWEDKSEVLRVRLS